MKLQRTNVNHSYSLSCNLARPVYDSHFNKVMFEKLLSCWPFSVFTKSSSLYICLCAPYLNVNNPRVQFKWILHESFYRFLANHILSQTISTAYYHSEWNMICCSVQSSLGSIQQYPLRFFLFLFSLLDLWFAFFLCWYDLRYQVIRKVDRLGLNNTTLLITWMSCDVTNTCECCPLTRRN